MSRHALCGTLQHMVLGSKLLQEGCSVRPSLCMMLWLPGLHCRLGSGHPRHVSGAPRSMLPDGPALSLTLLHTLLEPPRCACNPCSGPALNLMLLHTLLDPPWCAWDPCSGQTPHS